MENPASGNQMKAYWKISAIWEASCLLFAGQDIIFSLFFLFWQNFQKIPVGRGENKEEILAKCQKSRRRICNPSYQQKKNGLKAEQAPWLSGLGAGTITLPSMVRVPWVHLLFQHWSFPSKILVKMHLEKPKITLFEHYLSLFYNRK